MSAARRAGVLVAALVAALVTALVTASPASAEVVRPRGALGVSGDLVLTGPGPRNRFAADLTVYLRQRLGLYAAARQLTIDPLFDAGQVTAGIAYRAAAARPKLELVVHADAGAAWPLAPAAGGGVTTYLWPTKLPLAITTGTSAYLVLDGADNTRVVFSLGLGLALAR